jgi:hypothetical protein
MYFRLFCTDYLSDYSHQTFSSDLLALIAEPGVNERNYHGGKNMSRI